MNPITITSSIRHIPKEHWDAMAEGNIFSSYGWLLTVEESFLKGVRPKYFLYQENGPLSGAAVCYVVPRNVKVFSPDHLMFGRFKKFVNSMGIFFSPTLVCAPLKAYGKHLLLKKSITESKKNEIIELLLNEIEAEARRQKLSLSFSRILKHEKALIRQLSRRGYLQTLDLPLAYLDIAWNSFDEYKKNIRKRSLGMKKNISHEINKNRKAGVSIEILKSLTGQEKTLYDLLNKNYIKYNNTVFPFHANFLSRLKNNLKDDAVIYRSLKKGRVSGLGIMLRSGENGSVSFGGVDQRLAQNDATFFNMLFYRPITDAITDNIKRLYFGNAMYDMKIRRGCKIQNAYFFYKPCHPILKISVRLWFNLHLFWYQKKMPQLNHTADDENIIPKPLDDSGET